MASADKTLLAAAERIVLPKVTTQLTKRDSKPDLLEHPALQKRRSSAPAAVVSSQLLGLPPRPSSASKAAPAALPPLSASPPRSTSTTLRPGEGQGRRSSVCAGAIAHQLLQTQPRAGRRPSVGGASRCGTPSTSAASSRVNSVCRAGSVGSLGVCERRAPPPAHAWVVKGQQDIEGYSPEHVRFVAARTLSRKHRLRAGEVEKILEILDAAMGKRGLDFSGFRRAFGLIFAGQELEEARVAMAWEASTEDVNNAQVDIDSFLAWYAAEQRWEQLVSGDWVASEGMLQDLAEQHCVPVYVMDQVRRSFDRWDLSRSGAITFEQFQEGMRTHLRADEKARLSDDRILRFWSEINMGNKAELDFSQFVRWYMKYVDLDTEEVTIPKDACPSLRALIQMRQATRKFRQRHGARSDTPMLRVV